MKTFTQYFKSLTLLATMLLGTMNVWGAWTWTGEAHTNGDMTADFYVYNVVQNQWVGVDGSTPKTYTDLTNAIMFNKISSYRYGLWSTGYTLEFDNAKRLKCDDGNAKVATANEGAKTNMFWTAENTSYLNTYRIESQDGARYMEAVGDGQTLSFPKKDNKHAGNYNMWYFISADQVTTYNNRFFYFQANPQVGVGEGSVEAQGEVAYELTNYADRNNTHTQTLTFSATAAQGYQFGGWYETSDCSGDRVSNDNPYTPSVSNDAAGEAAKKTMTLYAKFVAELTPVIEINPGADAMLVDDAAAVASMFTTEYTPSLVYTLEDNDGILSLTDGTLTALKAGAATIVATQEAIPGSIKYAQKKFTITVSKRENPITVNGETDFAHTMAYGDQLPLTIVSANPAETLVISQTSGEGVVRCENNVLYANTQEGTATFAVTQPGDNKYFAGSATITVIVAPAQEEVCYVLEGEDAKIDIYGEKVYNFNQPGAKLSFQISRDATEAGSAHVSVKKGDSDWELLSDLTDKNRSYEFSIDEDVTAVRFHRGGIQISAIYIKNVKVTRKTYINPSVQELVLPTKSVEEASTQASFDVNWSCSNGGDICIESDNALFAVSQAVIENTDCNNGKATVIVTCTSNIEGEHSGHIIIYNKVRKVVLPVSVTVKAPAVRTYDGAAWDVAPTEFDAVRIAGNLDVNSPLTVAAMSIDEGVTVTVSDQLTLSHSDATAAATAGNLVVKDGGKVQVDGSGVLTVNDLVIETTQATSGQLVAEAERLKVLGDAYLDMQLSEGAITAGWYDFALPFDVDVESGIYRMTAEGPVKMKYATDYYISAYSEAARAQNLSGWSYHDAGTMQAGYQYMIYMLNTTNSTLRFRALDKEQIISTDAVAVSFSTGEEVYRGWNVIGNNTLACAAPELTAGVKVQVYDRVNDRYNTVEANDLRSYVGSSFAVQVDKAGAVPFVSPTVAAPARSMYADQTELCVRLSREGESEHLDQVFMSAHPYAIDSYEIGHDLLKMGAPASARVAQIWTSAYGYKLCDVELPLVQNVADFPLYLYSPCADAYSLSAIVPNGTQVYLMQNGMPVWDMSMGDYPLDLTKGEHAQYSIRMVYGAKVPTSVDETIEKSAAQKIFVDGQLYIVKNGTIFDVNGKRVK